MIRIGLGSVENSMPAMPGCNRTQKPTNENLPDFVQEISVTNFNFKKKFA
jgi:hypothetical protein